MAVEETIAVVGLQDESRSFFVEKMMRQDFRLLIIPEGKNDKLSLSRKFENKNVQAEIEVLDCAKDGCWEADVIAFLNPNNLEQALLNRIKEVAVQKIVLCVFEGDFSETEEKAENLQKLLPHSRIIKVEIAPEQEKVSISGKNDEAIEYISTLLKKASFEGLS